MPSIEISDTTFSLLQEHAKPLIDTADSVIQRALKALEAAAGAGPAALLKTFNPAAPPSLTHTKVLSIELGGTHFASNANYWNYLLFELIRRAAKIGRSPVEIKSLAVVNTMIGEKTDNGYRFIPEAGVSVQGQDSNGAWTGIYNLARHLGEKVEVTFEWYDNPKAAHPATRGRLEI